MNQLVEIKKLKQDMKDYALSIEKLSKTLFKLIWHKDGDILKYHTEVILDKDTIFVQSTRGSMVIATGFMNDLNTFRDVRNLDIDRFIGFIKTYSGDIFTSEEKSTFTDDFMALFVSLKMIAHKINDSRLDIDFENESLSFKHDIGLSDDERVKEYNELFKGTEKKPLKTIDEQLDTFKETLVDQFDTFVDSQLGHVGDNVRIDVTFTYEPENK